MAAVTIIDHSASRIGQIWGEDDHLRLVLTLQKIDQLAQQLHNMAAERSKEADLIIRANDEVLAK